MWVDMSQAQTFKVIPAPSAYRTGFLILAPAVYVLSWGTQVLDGPHMQLKTPTDTSPYGCALQEFIDTYQDVEGLPGTYIKRVTVKILRATAPLTVDTKEGPIFCPEGHYICEDGKGNQWPITPEVFKATYTGM